MDSLTQMVLGAAVGEAVLGKKIGNRAILWGAIAGTIPDLDVLPGYFMDEITALGFHRGFSHSLFFVVFGSFFFAYFSYRFFLSLWHDSVYVKWWNTLLSGGLFAVGSVILLISTSSLFWMVSGVLLLSAGLWIWVSMFRNYISKSIEVNAPSFREWYMLYFLGFLTHTLLDCFTTYGTQLYLPFADTRVAWNTIAVVDPLYTVPLLLFLIAAMLLKRENKLRTRLNYLGIALSTGYLVLTLFNKNHVENHMIAQLKLADVSYQRIMTTPTIFNNILWYGVAETENGYYTGFYSLMDPPDANIDWVYHERNESVLEEYKNSRVVRILKWFSDGFYKVKETEPGEYAWVDLRFGDMDFRKNISNEPMIFYFRLKADGNDISMAQERRNPENPGEMFAAYWSRILGR
jgi:inner membrane protein